MCMCVCVYECVNIECHVARATEKERGGEEEDEEKTKRIGKR